MQAALCLCVVHSTAIARLWTFKTSGDGCQTALESQAKLSYAKIQRTNKEVFAINESDLDLAASSIKQAVVHQ